ASKIMSIFEDKSFHCLDWNTLASTGSLSASAPTSPSSGMASSPPSYSFKSSVSMPESSYCIGPQSSLYFSGPLILSPRDFLLDSPASDRAMATACLRLVTFGPDFDPEWSSPLLNSPITFSTLPFPYLHGAGSIE